MTQQLHLLAVAGSLVKITAPAAMITTRINSTASPFSLRNTATKDHLLVLRRTVAQTYLIRRGSARSRWSLCFAGVRCRKRPQHRKGFAVCQVYFRMCLATTGPRAKYAGARRGGTNKGDRISANLYRIMSSFSLSQKSLVSIRPSRNRFSSNTTLRIASPQTRALSILKQTGSFSMPNS